MYTYANGDIYRGNWKDDDKNGLGHQTFANAGGHEQEGGVEGGGEWYKGLWKDGKIQGTGKVMTNATRYVCLTGLLYGHVLLQIAKTLERPTSRLPDAAVSLFEITLYTAHCQCTQLKKFLREEQLGQAKRMYAARSFGPGGGIKAFQLRARCVV